jgi:hypothetical protein
VDDRSAPVDAPATVPVTAGPPTPTRPARSRNRAGSVALVVAALVAVGGLAFAGGRLTAPASAATPGGGNGFRGGGNFPFASFGANGPGAGVFRGGTDLRSVSLRGQVTAISSDSITIQLDNGSSVTVPLDSQTTYHDSTAGSAADVTVGSTVTVEPGTTTFQPGASPAPGASFAPGGAAGALDFGPATDVTVIR